MRPAVPAAPTTALTADAPAFHSPLSIAVSDAALCPRFMYPTLRHAHVLPLAPQLLSSALLPHSATGLASAFAVVPAAHAAPAVVVAPAGTQWSIVHAPSALLLAPSPPFAAPGQSVRFAGTGTSSVPSSFFPSTFRAVARDETA